MSKFKVGDKVFLEAEIRQVDIEPYGVPYNVKFLNGATMWVDESNISRISKTYEDGLADAWKVLKHIQSGELSSKEIMDIWGMTDITFVNCFAQKYTPQEAFEILEAYEKSKQIQVGDVVHHTNSDEDAIVVCKCNDGRYKLMFGDFDISTNKVSEFTKTGRHIDIEHLLEQIRGDE